MSEFSKKDLEIMEKDITASTQLIVATSDFVSEEVLHQELLNRILKYHPNADTSMVEKAYQIARDAHEGQVRKSGEPYIIHPLCVAIILADLELDKETIVAGILHDVVEDTVMTKEEIAKTFSPEVAELVDGVTKLGQLSYNADKVEIQAENLRKMFLAMAKDIRVILIKLADRLHNMRTLKYMTPEKQKEKARETMEIYAPLAQRLGISKVKVELEDLSLKYIEPEAYYDLVEKIALRKNQREDYIQLLVDLVEKAIKESGIDAETYGRAKHFFSIYKKMVNQNKTIEQIYDLFAIRILVKDIKDCYTALGVIHEMYTPIPGRFKDYIAMPKPNMYQSLHTTVIGPNGTPFEIQIRTYDMHRTSEYGIAAHWKYKESGEGATVVGEEEKLSWLREILEWQQDIQDNREFSSLLKSDLNLFSDTVFCFTPTGDVKNLPTGSTPIDFAYSVHSAVGNKMVGAKINGRLVPIDYRIQNGDRIEIITSQNAKGPSRDWLSIVASGQAKNKINQWFRNQSKEENIAKGKELLLASAKAKGYEFSKLNVPEYHEKIKNKYGFHSWEDCLAAIGQGAIKEGAVINRLYASYRKDHPVTVTDEEILASLSGDKEIDISKKRQTKSKNGITVNGIHDVSVRFSKCCNPVPGDEIVGFVTRGRGVSIHRTDCVNMINLPGYEAMRLIDAEWAKAAVEETTDVYLTELKIFSNNRTGLLVDLTRTFTERDINIEAIHSNTNKQGVATIIISFGINSKNQLGVLVEKIRQIPGIIDVERSRG
ncbi:MAG: bifunctional (p)ppGpp synthetase/guanosine-3',5'-bis(diphosphate) 3'-pyrophosphohydrolase [Pseudobutyrivibrio sp.]|nr:bifunctional (p)ppGpp synthetase/guanosine-3',5'-bis(diphosphate) 3'-pyrophosphohydrolase [Pseudobutyrivibrio sp.]